MPVSPESGMSCSLNGCCEHEIHCVSPVTKKEQIYQINPSRLVHVTVWYSAIKIYIKISINIYLQCTSKARSTDSGFGLPDTYECFTA